MDGYAASSIIFTTVLYGLRVREPQFYITSFAVENIVLVLYLWDNLRRDVIITWYLSICSFFVVIIKWRTVWRYLLRFKCLSFLFSCCGITAIIMYSIASKEFYNELSIISININKHDLLFYLLAYKNVVVVTMQQRS